MLSFFTDDLDRVGENFVTVRNCDRHDRLIELNFHIDVLPNSYPEFDDELKTSFEVDYNEPYEYLLPYVRDKEDNDEAIILIEKFDNELAEFPPFLETYD